MHHYAHCSSCHPFGNASHFSHRARVVRCLSGALLFIYPFSFNWFSNNNWSHRYECRRLARSILVSVALTAAIGMVARFVSTQCAQCAGTKTTCSDRFTRRRNLSDGRYCAIAESKNVSFPRYFSNKANRRHASLDPLTRENRNTKEMNKLNKFQMCRSLACASCILATLAGYGCTPAACRFEWRAFSLCVPFATGRSSYRIRRIVYDEKDATTAKRDMTRKKALGARLLK